MKTVRGYLHRLWNRLPLLFAALPLLAFGIQGTATQIDEPTKELFQFLAYVAGFISLLGFFIPSKKLRVFSGIPLVIWWGAWFWTVTLLNDSPSVSLFGESILIYIPISIAWSWGTPWRGELVDASLLDD